MNICIVSPGTIPRKFYGGTERVISWLATALSKAGNRVTLVAPKGSSHQHVNSLLEYDLPSGNINFNPPDILPLIPDDSDIVHIHFAFEKAIPWPTLKTVHGYPFHYTGREVYASPDEFDQLTCFVSDSHRNVCGLPNNPFVYNGLEPGEYIFRDKKQNYFLFLGKVDWNVKGLYPALDIANKTGIELVIAGDFLDPDFYKKELRPRLNTKIQYIGPVGGKEKAELLADAKALLFPTLWPEPFGLVSIEAMISGTPVLGTQNGALPEIIVHGKTGFLASRISETIEYIQDIDKISPNDCRSHVFKNFTSSRMAKNYISLYKKILTLYLN